MATNVRLAAEEADRMITEQNRLRTEAMAATEPENPSQEAEAITDQPTEEAGNQTDVAVQASSEPQVSSSELLALKKEVESANQRWKVLQGMIEKKDAEVDNMRALLAQMSQRAETPKEESAQAFNQQDMEYISDFFGERGLEIVGRKSTEVFQSLMQPVMNRIAQLEQSITGVGEMTAKVSADSFDDQLTRQVSDWKAVNVDPAFLGWLNEEEGFSGATRMSLLQDAYSKQNLSRTARFFTAFKELTGQATKQVTAPVKDNVTKLITPGKSRSSVTPQAPQGEKQIWSKDDISRLYSDKRTGKITQEEFDKYERDLFKAQGEGRIAA